MSEFTATVRELFISFRDSVIGLFDSDINGQDVKGLLWLAVVGVVVVVVLSVLRGFENRRPMGR